HRLGVPPETERRVDQDGVLVGQRGCEQRDDPVQQHRDVGGGHRQLPSAVTSRRAAAKATDTAAENAISATTSRAWCRTRLSGGWPASVSTSETTCVLIGSTLAVLSCAAGIRRARFSARSRRPASGREVTVWSRGRCPRR